MRKITIIALVIFFVKLGIGQDVHHTLNWLTPSNINIAKVGAEKNATYLGVILRNQNFTIGPNFYRRNSLVLDHRGNSKFGFGVNMHYAQTGEVGTRALNSQGVITYHQSIGAKTSLSLGAKGGLGQFQLFNRSDLRLEEQISGSGTNELIAEDNPLSFVAGTGCVLTHNFNTFKGQVGFDTRYRWHPSLYESDYINDLQWLNKFFLSTYIPLKGFDLNSSLFYQKLGDYYELQLQSYASIHLKRDQSKALILGGGWRYNDALQAMVGYKLKNVQIMVAYDHNISDLAAATRGVGSIELGARYIIKRQPKDRSIELLNGLPMLDLDVLASGFYGNKSRLPIPTMGLQPSIDESYAYTPWLDRDESNSKPQLNPIYYDYDGIEVSSEYLSILTELEQYLKANHDAKLLVDSYTDHKGPNKYNNGLSKSRAEEIKRILVANGINSDRIIAVGHGETNFILDCSDRDCTDEERRVNRRSILTIIVTPVE